MNKLFVRLVASGAIAGGMGTTALASNISIDTTGPGSTNTVTSRSCNSFDSNVYNLAELGNWNFQDAHSGDVRTNGNTRVSGGNGSGWAGNSNSSNNMVDISNGNNGWSSPLSFGGGNGDATIFLTGPDSINRINLEDSNRFTSNTTNDVNATNFNAQQARSGDVNIHGNTVVSGGGGSGNASNENSGVNNVSLTNSNGLGAGAFTSGGGNNGSARISTTGPDSYNSIRSNNNSSVDLNTQNRVSANNVNLQSARSGNVDISHNTVVGGGAESGWAANQNSGNNSVSINN